MKKIKNITAILLIILIFMRGNIIYKISYAAENTGEIINPTKIKLTL